MRKERDTRLTYTVPEAAKLLGIGRNQGYEAAKTGDLPTIRIGGRILIPRDALHEKLAQAGQAPTREKRPGTRAA